MDWKEFLKPDWRKICIVEFLFVLYLIFSLTYLYVNSVIFMGLSAACSMGFFSCAYRPGATNATSDFERFRESATKYPELVEKLPSNFYISVLSLGFGKITSIYDTFFINSILSILQFIIMFLYWYFLSCIVVWIYDKFKKKQHSE